jgi:hypothetical protein
MCDIVRKAYRKVCDIVRNAFRNSVISMGRPFGIVCDYVIKALGKFVGHLKEGFTEMYVTPLGRP